MNKSIVQLVVCYLLWGFQPLYWTKLSGFDSFTVLAFRIFFAAVFSLAILAFTGRIKEYVSAIKDWSIMKYILPALIFIFTDWALFIVAVQNGHVLDASLGYYINPLVIFAIGVVVYKEKCNRVQLIALLIAVVGVIVSTISLGKLPLLSLVIAFVWAIYASIKKSVHIDGVVSIAIETSILSIFSLVFLLFFKRNVVASATPVNWIFIVGSGIVTALPMYLYSNTVSRLPLILMCFAQYMGPTFNIICGLIMGESFTQSQIISFAFFVCAVAVFTVSEVKKSK